MMGNQRKMKWIIRLVAVVEAIVVFDFTSIVVDIYTKKVLNLNLNLFGPMIYRVIALVLGIILIIYGIILYKKYRK